MSHICELEAGRGICLGFEDYARYFVDPVDFVDDFLVEGVDPTMKIVAISTGSFVVLMFILCLFLYFYGCICPQKKLEDEMRVIEEDLEKRTRQTFKGKFNLEHHHITV